MKQSIMDFTKKEMESFIKPSFRVKQIYGWIYHHYINNFDAMKNLPKKYKRKIIR